MRLTWYVTSRDDYYAELPGIGAAYRAVIGRHFPAMSVVQVVALMEAAAKAEIEATAVIPDPAGPTHRSAITTRFVRDPAPDLIETAAR